MCKVNIPISILHSRNWNQNWKSMWYINPNPKLNFYCIRSKQREIIWVREKGRGTWSLEAWRWTSSRRRERWCRCHERRRRRYPCAQLRARIRLERDGHREKRLLWLYRTSPSFFYCLWLRLRLLLLLLIYSTFLRPALFANYICNSQLIWQETC